MCAEEHLEHRDKDHRTPLLTATASGSIEAMCSLVEGSDQTDGDSGNDGKYDATKSATDNRKCNVIHLAVETGDVNVLKVREIMFLIYLQW